MLLIPGKVFLRHTIWLAHHLLISRSSRLPLVLFATIEIDDLMAPSTLFSSILEILQRALKNIIIIKTKSTPSSTMGMILYGDNLLRLQSTQQLNSLLRVHRNHNMNNRQRCPPKMNQSQVDLRIPSMDFLPSVFYNV